MAEIVKRRLLCRPLSLNKEEKQGKRQQYVHEYTFSSKMLFTWVIIAEKHMGFSQDVVKIR
jgi:hypothetical protein